MQSEGDIGNYSPDLFHKDEVHKIAILDLRILNLDRNEGNILVKTKLESKTQRKVRTLVPIDHGLSIPDNLSICSYDLAWLSWRQAEKPFSSRSMKFIEEIDIAEDIRLLESTFKFRPICLRNARISSLLLKRSALAGLTLAQIGQLLCRPDEDDTVPSLLERIVDKARLIADMMWRMQSKIKDSNLRNIDNTHDKNGKKPNYFDVDEEEEKGNSSKRNRINSISSMSFTATLQSNVKQLPQNAFAALGADDNSNYRV